MRYKANKIEKRKEIKLLNKMDLKEILFTSLLELQGLIQLYNSYSTVLKFNTPEVYDKLNPYQTFRPVLAEKIYDNSIMKMENYLVNIKLKVSCLGLDEKLEGILDNKIPVITKLKNYPPYEEFLRTNYEPIMKVIFEVPPKSLGKNAFRMNFCEFKGNYYI